MRTRFSSLCLVAVLSLSPVTLPAQETSEAVAVRQALQQNMSALNARVEDLEASNVSLRAKVDDLKREIQQLREEARRLGDHSAVQEQMRRLADSVKEVDSKRRSDNDKVLGELAKLAKQIADTPVAPPPQVRPHGGSTHNATPATDNDSKPTPPSAPQKGIEYVIKSGDTLSGVVDSCRQKGLKMTQKIMKEANPDINWDRLRVGQKIFIPIPNS